ncbi:MAG: hypothetical protein IT555_18910 [Acetobacteraceae bacterium]|nr:hypothetical protein [Acetobacteraceae bacterium]
MTVEARTTLHKRTPGRKPSPEHLEEIGRVWHAVDDDARKMILYFVRGVARERGLVAPDTPLMITDRVF